MIALLEGDRDAYRARDQFGCICSPEVPRACDPTVYERLDAYAQRCAPQVLAAAGPLSASGRESFECHLAASESAAECYAPLTTATACSNELSDAAALCEAMFDEASTACGDYALDALAWYTAVARAATFFHCPIVPL